MKLFLEQILCGILEINENIALKSVFKEILIVEPFDSINAFINRNPVTISSSMAIHDAMKLMGDRQSQISVLPVVDNKKCVGLLRLHDLYQTKLL